MLNYTIIIPAYNEEERIKNTLIEYAKYFKIGCEIIVISDSYDNTNHIVTEIKKQYPSIKLFSYSNKLGKGGAIREGFKYARGDIIGFLDADMPITPSQYNEMFNRLDIYDCVIASRKVEDSIIIYRQPQYREIVSKVFNALVNKMFGLKIRVPIHDTQCGAKVFTRDTIDKILPKLKTTGFEFDVELLWRIRMLRYSIKEHPVTWTHQQGSRFSFKYIPLMMLNLLWLKTRNI